MSASRIGGTRSTYFDLYPERKPVASTSTATPSPSPTSAPARASTSSPRPLTSESLAAANGGRGNGGQVKIPKRSSSITSLFASTSIGANNVVAGASGSGLRSGIQQVGGRSHSNDVSSSVGGVSGIYDMPKRMDWDRERASSIRERGTSTSERRTSASQLGGLTSALQSLGGNTNGIDSGEPKPSLRSELIASTSAVPYSRRLSDEMEGQPPRSSSSPRAAATSNDYEQRTPPSTARPFPTILRTPPQSPSSPFPTTRRPLGSQRGLVNSTSSPTLGSFHARDSRRSGMPPGSFFGDPTSPPRSLNHSTSFTSDVFPSSPRLARPASAHSLNSSSHSSTRSARSRPISTVFPSAPSSNHRRSTSSNPSLGQSFHDDPAADLADLFAGPTPSELTFGGGPRSRETIYITASSNRLVDEESLNFYDLYGGVEEEDESYEEEGHDEPVTLDELEDLDRTPTLGYKGSPTMEKTGKEGWSVVGDVPRPEPEPETPKVYIKSIDEIVREHSQSLQFMSPRPAPAPPIGLAGVGRTTSAQELAQGVSERQRQGSVSSEASTSRVGSDASSSSVGSLEDDVRKSPRKVKRKPVPKLALEDSLQDEVTWNQPKPHSFVPVSSTTPTRNQSYTPAAMLTPTPTTPTTSLRQASPSPLSTSELELATLLKSPRLTRLITLKRVPNAGLTVSLADVGNPTGHPVVVFLGLGCVRYIVALYDEIAEAYGLRLICIDRWGMGKTGEVEDDKRGFLEWANVVGEVVDELGLPRYSLLAHSAGSPYALAASLWNPSRVTGSIHLLAPWVSTSSEESLAGAYKYLKYVPTGVIKTAQAAEWKMTSWRLGKPPMVVHEPVGYDHRAVEVVGSSGKGDEGDREFDGGSAFKTPSGRAKAKWNRSFLGGIFGSGGSSGGKESGMKATPNSTSLSPSGRGSPNLMRRSSVASSTHSFRSDTPKSSTDSYTVSLPPNIPTTATGLPVSPASTTLLSSSISIPSLANGILRASHAESLRGSSADLMVVLERGSKPWGFTYEEVQTRVKVWIGDKDERISLGSVRSFEREVKGECSIEVVPGADHSLMTNGAVMLSVLESIANEWSTFN